MRIPTEIGAIKVRRAGVRRGARFEWRWSSGDVWNGPFERLIECLSDLSAAYELAIEAVRADAARRRAGTRGANQ